MARTKISEFSATPGDNTDIDGIDIAEGCAPSGINNAIRELMAQLKDMQTGASGDTFTLTTVNSTTVDTTNLEATNLKAKDGTAAGSIANSTGVVTLGSSVLTTTDINGGTVDGTTIGATTPSTVVATQVDITAQGDLRLQDTTGGQYVALQAPGTVASSYTLTLPVDDGTAGQALITDGSGVLSWSTAASGDVYGPASATDNAVARFDSTTGKIIQNSAVTIGDDGATVIAANSSSDGLRITQLGGGNALLVEDSANPDATPFVVDSNGNVGIGDSSPSTYVTGGLVAKSSSSFSPAVMVWNKTNDASSPIFTGRKDRNGAIVQSGDELCRIFAAGYDGASYISAASIIAHVDGTPGTNDMPGRLVFSTTADGASSPTERMRIGNQGSVAIGGSLLSEQTLRVTRNLTGSTFAASVLSGGTIQSGVTSRADYFSTFTETAAASFTLANLNHYLATQGTFGLGSTVTNQYGFNAGSTLTGATNNYGFYGNIASGTGRWNFYAAGTADNYFAGNVGIGAIAPTTTLSVAASGSTNTAAATAVGLVQVNHAGISSLASSGGIEFKASTFGSGYGAKLIAFDSGDLIFANRSNSASWTERMRINFNGVISLGAAPGAESLRVTPVASAVNYLEVKGAATGGLPNLSAQGSDANINIWYYAKGTGAHGFATNNTTQFNIAHTASAVNYLQVTGGATGSGAAISAQGSDANIQMYYVAKGTGFHSFLAGGNTQFQIINTASAVNVLQVTGAATGSPPRLSAQGTDANIGLSVSSKGTFDFNVFTNNFAQRQFSVAHAPSAVNYFQVTGAATGAGPSITSQGTDADIGLNITSKGTFGIVLATGGGWQFSVANTASAVNYLQATGGATGASATLLAQGSDTNIDLALTPKGTGVLKFGTHTAGILAQSGYITIKDAAGNTRNLLVG
jgi:hypothetical protein